MSSTEIQKTVTSIFEQIRKIDTNGIEYWSARDFAKALEYVEYRNFIPVLNRAKEACKNSGHPISDHFVEMNEMVKLGSGAERQVDSVKLWAVPNWQPTFFVLRKQKKNYVEKTLKANNRRMRHILPLAEKYGKPSKNLVVQCLKICRQATVLKSWKVNRKKLKNKL